MLITKSQVKYIQSLGHKKFRDTEGVFVVEGPKITSELLQAPNMRLRWAYALPQWIGELPADLRRRFGVGGPDRAASADRRPHAPDRPGFADGTITEVGPVDLERLSALATPNQVVAVFEKPVFSSPDLNTGVYLVLDGIQDPGNLGTIVRLADWFGLTAVICSPDSADVFNAKAVQSTMGSISRVAVVYEETAALIRRTTGMTVYAATLEGERLYDMDRIRQGFIVIGNESKGIRPELQELAGRRVTIPRIGQAESLNAAVATGIILSHLVG
jgi:RNA methyltransferase, TrmH family